MAKLTKAQRAIERAQKTIERSRAVLNQDPVAVSPFIAGGSNYSPAMGKRLDRQVERTIDAAAALQKAQRDLVSAQNLQAGIEAGELYPNGQRRKDAPSKLRAKSLSVQIAEFLRSYLKVGDTVVLAGNHDSTLIIKRLNTKTITSESGTKWEYSEIMPLLNGKPMTTSEFIAARREWLAALEATS